MKCPQILREKNSSEKYTFISLKRQWKVLQTYQIPKYRKRYPTIYSFKGELYFTDPLHGIPGYMIQKSILADKNEEEPKYLVSAIPYIGYE